MAVAYLSEGVDRGDVAVLEAGGGAVALRQAVELGDADALGTHHLLHSDTQQPHT